MKNSDPAKPSCDKCPPKPVRTAHANSSQGRAHMWPLPAWGSCKSKPILKYLAGTVLSSSISRSCRENISNIHVFVTMFTGRWKYICRTYQSAAEENSFLCTSHVSRHSCWLLGIAWLLLMCRACGWGGTGPAPTGLGAGQIKNKKAISNLKSLSSSIFILLAGLLLNLYTVMPQ